MSDLKFRVGDLVKAVSDLSTCAAYRNKLGFIISANPYNYSVKFLDSDLGVVSFCNSDSLVVISR